MYEDKFNNEVLGMPNTYPTYSEYQDNAKHNTNHTIAEALKLHFSKDTHVNTSFEVTDKYIQGLYIALHEYITEIYYYNDNSELFLVTPKWLYRKLEIAKFVYINRKWIKLSELNNPIQLELEIKDTE